MQENKPHGGRWWINSWKVRGALMVTLGLFLALAVSAFGAELPDALWTPLAAGFVAAWTVAIGAQGIADAKRAEPPR